MSASAPLSEKEHYAEFVEASLSELRYGLEIDGTTSKGHVSKRVNDVMTSTAKNLKDHAGIKVLCARFALGADDTAYLQSGLAVLWSTVAHKDRNDDLALAPAALYSPDAVGGIRRGLLRALEAKHKETLENAEDNLRVLVNALKGMLAVPRLQQYASKLSALLDAEPVDPVALAQALCELKKVLDGDGNNDLAASILDRVDCLTKLVKTREALKREKAAVTKAETERERAYDVANTATERAAAAESAERAANVEADTKATEAVEAKAAQLRAERLAKNLRDKAVQAEAAARAANERASKNADEAAAAKAAKEVADQRRAAAEVAEQAATDAEFVALQAADASAAEAAEAKAAFQALSAETRGDLREGFEEIATPETTLDVFKEEWTEWLRAAKLFTLQMFVWGIIQFWMMQAGRTDALIEDEEAAAAAAAADEAAAAGFALVLGDTNTSAPQDDPHVATVLVRGLVGQRGPTEPATTAAADAKLAYALPPPAPLAKSLPVARALLERLPAPTAHEVDAALAALAKPPPTDATAAAEGEVAPAAKRACVLALPKPTPTSVVHAALTEFGDNFAVVGATPAAENDARCGVEPVHQVRWLPQGPRAATMAQAAVLEHAIARCEQLLEDPAVAAQPAIAQAVRDAAASLKLQQLEPLYALHEAVAFDDAPHPLGTATPLVTRPCAVVRGALAYPTDAGVAPLPFQCAPSAHNEEADLKGAMKTTQTETTALRNALRREGVATNVYVAPAVDTLGYERMAPVTAVGADAEGAEAEAQKKREATKKAVSAADEAKQRLDEASQNTRAAYQKLLNTIKEEKTRKDARVDAERQIEEYKDEMSRFTLTTPSDTRDEAQAGLEQAEKALKQLDAELPYIEKAKKEGTAEQRDALDAQENKLDALTKALKAASARVQEAEAATDRAKAEVQKTADAERKEREQLSAALAATLTNESVYATDFALPTLRRLVNQAIVTLAAIKHKRAGGDCTDAPIDAFLKEELVQSDGVDASQRREGLWTEFHRHLSISQDRLWVFVRLLSGSIGGDVNEIITMADEASQQATKALQAQRVEVAKRVSDTQSKIVESVVGAMLKESRLALDAKADNLVVMDTQARQDLRDLASGASGRPFFEANVACRNLEKKYEPMKLTQLLASLADVGRQMQRSLDTALTQPGLASASLLELSHPSNSFFVSMKADASAAIRIAHERCNAELAARGGGRRLALWELVEGGCPMLTTRFAEFTGHMLVQNRASTGVSAMYVSRMAIETNAMQARITLARLTNAAEVYAARVARPAFGTFDAADPTRPRRVTMDEGARVTETDVARPRPRGDPRIGYGHLYSQRSASGWWVQ